MSLLKEKTVLSNIILPNPASQIDELVSLRSYMLRFARLELQDDVSAEDAVQEAFASALSGLKKFNNQAQLKTWVFTILKNKIIDIIRERKRSPNTDMVVNDYPEDAYDEIFNESGCWEEDTRPSNWVSPELSFSNSQFWKIFDICLTRLPDNTARIFMMREVLGFETEEICKELAISQSNCWVVLHRARMGLRLCLDERWFNSESYNAKL